MVNERLLSRCGIYCGACYVYRAERDGGALLDEMSRVLGVSHNKIRCNGCSAPYEEQWPNCQSCSYKTCQGKRGIKNCAQCVDFNGCNDYQKLVDFTKYRGEDVRGALRRINAGEGDEILQEQLAWWSCPRCGAPLQWYDNNCRGCGLTIREKHVTLDGYKEKT